MTIPNEMVERGARAIAPLAWAALGTGDTLAQANRRKASLRHARAALEAALSGHVVVPRTISDSQLNKALGREEDARITPMFSMFRDFYHNIVAAPPVQEMEPNPKPTAGAS